MFPWYIRAVLAIGGTVALVWGIHFVSTSVANASPVKMTYADYCRQGASSEWLELDGGWVDFRYSVEIAKVTSKSRSAIERDYYVPVFDPNSTDPNIHVFLKCQELSSRSDALNCIEGLLGSGSRKVSEENQRAWFETNEAKYRRPMNVKGLVLRGLSESTEHRDLLLEAANGHLAPNFVVIDENQEPDSVAGILLLALAGVLYLLVGLTFFVWGRPARKQQPAYIASDYAPPQSRQAMNSLKSSTPEGRTSNQGERPPWEQ